MLLDGEVRERGREIEQNHLKANKCENHIELIGLFLPAFTPTPSTTLPCALRTLQSRRLLVFTSFGRTLCRLTSQRSKGGQRFLS